jgi:tRNA(Ile)-lysidine synthase
VTPGQAERFAAGLARLWPESGRLGLAVSGGPDSLALLLLAHAAIPGRFEVATVDHGLRAESATECAMVARTCAGRGIACAVLPVTVPPGNTQAAARGVRYGALAPWARDKRLSAIATAHHADDQVETLLMRLNRASGLAGLAGVRARGIVPASELPLLRPLLGWRRSELAAIVAGAGLEPAQDPSNSDESYDRVRIRRALSEAEWLDVEAVAASAAHLADADEAIDWIAARDWALNVAETDGEIRYRCTVPRAVALRVVGRIVDRFGGSARGAAVARLVDDLAAGRGGNVGGVAAKSDGDTWVFRREPARRG